MHLLGRTAVNDRRLARRTGSRQGLATAREKSGTAVAGTAASRREMAACQELQELQGRSVTPPGDRDRSASVVLVCLPRNRISRWHGSLCNRPCQSRPLSRSRRIKADRPQTVAITRRRDAKPLWFLFVAVTLLSPYGKPLSVGIGAFSAVSCPSADGAEIPTRRLLCSPR